MAWGGSLLRGGACQRSSCAVKPTAAGRSKSPHERKSQALELVPRGRAVAVGGRSSHRRGVERGALRRAAFDAANAKRRRRLRRRRAAAVRRTAWGRRSGPQRRGRAKRVRSGVLRGGHSRGVRGSTSRRHRRYSSNTGSARRAGCAAGAVRRSDFRCSLRRASSGSNGSDGLAAVLARGGIARRAERIRERDGRGCATRGGKPRVQTLASRDQFLLPPLARGNIVNADVDVEQAVREGPPGAAERVGSVVGSRVGLRRPAVVDVPTAGPRRILRPRLRCGSTGRATGGCLRWLLLCGLLLLLLALLGA